ncbi:single-stranded DNA-binding protein WHY2, mitochondrial [Impatiens glandulifera]|uniref:single-stranded DNA-binding protein WHY2, mitochondrial n=1 Tax=Impatiens glandulifera TaxID=253017 RepID=UPI001FB0829F|nr:single-stranded DNA-binding protein WHY2, mitochondrial [Impatiens glandulifera]
MSKLAGLLRSRNTLSRIIPLRNTGTSLDSSYTGIATLTSSTSDGSSKSRVFAPYSIYKGKAALSAVPILPTLCKLESGGMKVERRGAIMLTFSPAIGERKYDWEKKQMFALSAIEVGAMISLPPKESCEFFHDPGMSSSNAGHIRKSLSIKAHDSGYFLSLNVVNNVMKTTDRFTVPVTTAEFAVMRTAFNFALPHLMGWDLYLNPQGPKNIDQNASRVVPQLMDSEWDR